MTSEVTPDAPITTDQIISPVVQEGGSSAQVGSVQPTVDKTPEPEPVVDPAKPSEDAAKPKEDENRSWPESAMKRVNEITAARYAEQRRAEAAIAEAAALKKLNSEILAAKGTPVAADPAKPAAAPIAEDEIERRANEKATLIAQANVFNKACNDVAETGKKTFGADWDKDLQNLTLVGALGKDVSPAFLETVIELKDPHKIMHHLGSNMDEASRIAKLPPTKMALEMARIEAQLSAPVAPAPLPPVSNAPAPVITVGGNATPGQKSLDDPTLSMDEFNEIRNKQREAKLARYKRA